MKITTANGYAFFEATSAFQKSIRLGDEQTALFFAVEFFNSGYDEYAWKRLKIIASEDIGLAAPTLPATLQALYVSYSEQKKDSKDSKPERLFLVHAVLLLVRSKKSRIVDYLSISLWREHDSNLIAVPDYAYDMHNLQGKRLGRGLDHFYEHGTKLNNQAEIPGEAEAKEHAKEWHKKVPGKLSFAGFKKGTLTQQRTIFDDQTEPAE